VRITRTALPPVTFAVALTVGLFSPSITSADDAMPLIVFLTAEREYRTDETLPKFFEKQLEPRGYRAEFVFAAEKDRNRFEGLEALEKADLLVLSIACDIVPIVGENRVLAHKGLEKLRQNPAPGIKILKEQADGNRNWDISDLVFFIGPRINSAGRLEHGSAAVEVLMGRSEALHDLASALQDSNNARKEMDKVMTEQALEQIEKENEKGSPLTNVLYDESWHKGIIGIVASRVIEKHYRPTVLLTRTHDKLVGSARSVSGFDLYAALEACDQHILQWGGHTYAAGLTLKADQFEAFKTAFEKTVSERITAEQRVPSIWIDTELSFREIDGRFIRLMNRMAPFGPQNRRPVFQTKGVKVLRADILKEAHVRFLFEKEDRTFKGIGFNLAEKWFSLNTEMLDIAYQPTFNHWKQRVSIDLRLKDIKSSYEA